MRIQFNSTIGTYTAIDHRGVVLSLYRPDKHGTVEEWITATREEGL